MKTAIGVLVASFSLIAGAAQAASLDNATSQSKTRTQVVAELAQAQAAGLISKNNLDYPVSLPAAQSKSRQQVVAELAQARISGQLSRNTLDYPPATEPASAKSRAEVVGQLVAYQASRSNAYSVNRH
ncbi:MAG TPA: DUF4148 domain-containing protein [Pusillimonas sp.]